MSFLNLRIGPFHIQVACDQPAILTHLQQRYAGFWDNHHEPAQSYSVHIQTIRASSPFVEGKKPDFSPHRLQFSPPGWEGEINTGRQTGWIRPASKHAIEEIDYFLRVVCAVQVFQAGGLLFHAAGVLRHGQVFVFFGPSGAGKTTVSRLSGARNVINDDLIVLYPDATAGWNAHSTPFSNPTQVAPLAGQSAPLAGLYRLVQDQQVFLEEISPGQALAEVMASVPVISTHSMYSLDLLTRCQSFLENVPIFRLHFRQDDSFWKVIDS